MTEPAKPWAVYIRVSTDDQAEEGASIPAQRASCLAYAKQRGWVVPDALVLIDDGYTGRNAKRPGFQRVLQLLRDRAVVGVVAWKLKRLARSTKVTSELLELLQATGGEMACVAESWDTTTPMGRAMIGVGAIFAQLESEDNGVQTSAAMQHLRREGFFTGGPVPAGTRVEAVDGGKRRRLVPGEGADTVARRFGDAGITPPGRAAAAPAKAWTPQAVHNLLLSPQVVPVLVDAATQAVVRQRLASRTSPLRRGADRGGSRAAAPSPLAGLLRCPACGATMFQTTGKGNGGTYRYFRCTGRDKRLCAAKQVRADVIEREVLAGVAAACQPGSEYQAVMRAELEDARGRLGEARVERTRLQAQRDQVTARISDMTLNQQIGTPQWNEGMKALGAKLEQIDARLAELRGLVAAAEVDQGSIDMVLAMVAARAARLPTLPVDEQAATLRDLVGAVRVEADQVVIDLYRPQTKAAGVSPGGSCIARQWRPSADGSQTVRVRVARATARAAGV